MSDYTRLYNLTIKDSLPSGNSGKVIKGAELDAEYNAIVSAIASKSGINSPTFTGTPAAPTATFGTNTTQLATTAFVQAALQAIYPVGSVYINATSSSNPSTLLGFGTWEAFGTGRVLVGIDSGDADFDTLGETGGSKSSVSSHTHTVSVSGSTGNAGTHSHGVSDPGHNHGGLNAAAYPDTFNSSPYFPNNAGVGTGYNWATTTGISIQNAGDHAHSVYASGTTASTGTSNGNLQPYVVVRMWKRTS